MTPHQQYLLTGYGIALFGLLLIAGLIIFMRSNWATQKKGIGVVVFIFGFGFLWVAWQNLAPYLVSKNFVVGQVKSTDCSRYIGGRSSVNLPDCNYEVVFSVDNKAQTAKINSEGNSIVLSQGEQVEVYRQKDDVNNYNVQVGHMGDSKNFFIYLFSHWLVIAFVVMAMLFFYTGLKWMGFVSFTTYETADNTLISIIKR